MKLIPKCLNNSRHAFGRLMQNPLLPPTLQQKDESLNKVNRRNLQITDKLTDAFLGTHNSINLNLPQYARLGGNLIKKNQDGGKTLRSDFKLGRDYNFEEFTPESIYEQIENSDYFNSYLEEAFDGTFGKLTQDYAKLKNPEKFETYSKTPSYISHNLIEKIKETHGTPSKPIISMKNADFAPYATNTSIFRGADNTDYNALANLIYLEGLNLPEVLVRPQ